MFSVVVLVALSNPLGAAQNKTAPGAEPAPVPRETQNRFPNRAILIVDLPPDTELYIDNRYVRTISNRRTFVTPELCPEATYFYDLKASLVSGFQPYTEIKRVLVRPGEVVRVSFPNLGVPDTEYLRIP